MANSTASAAKAATARTTRSKTSLTMDAPNGSTDVNQGQNTVTQNGAELTENGNQIPPAGMQGNENGALPKAAPVECGVDPLTALTENNTAAEKAEIPRAVTPPPLPMVTPATPVQTPGAPTPEPGTPGGPGGLLGVTQHELNIAFGLLPNVVNPQGNVDRRLMETREALSEDAGFVAEVAVRSGHVWVMETRVLRVVTKAAMTEAQKLHAEYTLQDDPSLPTPEPADSAKFTAIVRIHTENCFLQPDAAWNPSRTHAGLFEDIKLRFSGVSPLHPDGLVDDFESTYNNLKWLMSQIPDATKERQGLLSAENGLRWIMFQHVVFEPLTKANAYTADELALPSQYRTEGWPVMSTASQTALNAIQDTHRTRPLQAYDMHGALIPPSEYMSKLQGAVVVVRFNMAAYVFGQVPKHRHTFVGDITYLRVLVPPTAPSVPVSLRKRNVHACDPFGDKLRSPSKRARLE